MSLLWTKQCSKCKLHSCCIVLQGSIWDRIQVFHFEADRQIHSSFRHSFSGCLNCEYLKVRPYWVHCLSKVLCTYFISMSNLLFLKNSLMLLVFDCSHFQPHPLSLSLDFIDNSLLKVAFRGHSCSMNFLVFNLRNEFSCV